MNDPVDIGVFGTPANPRDEPRPLSLATYRLRTGIERTRRVHVGAGML
jgi:hypothetical protein